MISSSKPPAPSHFPKKIRVFSCSFVVPFSVSAFFRSHFLFVSKSHSRIAGITYDAGERYDVFTITVPSIPF